jgi:uncharacterized protein RhaS with RHS repeats
MSSAPSVNPQPASAGPPAAPKKGSGLKIFLWILGIFVGLAIVGIIGVTLLLSYFVHKVKQAADNPVYAAAKFAVAANPDLETVSSDDSTGSITVRERKTGKTVRMKFDPASKTMVVTDENGKTASMRFDPDKRSIVMTDDQGKTASVTADAQGGNIEVKSPDGTVKIGASADKAPDWVPVYSGVTPTNNFSAHDANSMAGSYNFVTSDPVDKVLSYFGDSLKSGGFKVSTTTSNSDGKVAGLVSGTNEGDKRTVVVTASTENDGTHVNVAFNAKN